MLVVWLVDSDSHNDVSPEAQRYVTIVVLQGAVRPSSSPSIRVADIIRLFFLDYTALVAGNIRLQCQRIFATTWLGCHMALPLLHLDEVFPVRLLQENDR